MEYTPNTELLLDSSSKLPQKYYEASFLRDNFAVSIDRTGKDLDPSRNNQPLEVENTKAKTLRRQMILSVYDLRAFAIRDDVSSDNLDDVESEVIEDANISFGLDVKKIKNSFDNNRVSRAIGIANNSNGLLTEDDKTKIKELIPALDLYPLVESRIAEISRNIEGRFEEYLYEGREFEFLREWNNFLFSSIDGLDVEREEISKLSFEEEKNLKLFVAIKMVSENGDEVSFDSNEVRARLGIDKDIDLDDCIKVTKLKIDLDQTIKNKLIEFATVKLPRNELIAIWQSFGPVTPLNDIGGLLENIASVYMLDFDFEKDIRNEEDLLSFVDIIDMQIESAISANDIEIFENSIDRAKAYIDQLIEGYESLKGSSREDFKFKISILSKLKLQQIDVDMLRTGEVNGQLNEIIDLVCSTYEQIENIPDEFVVLKHIDNWLNDVLDPKKGSSTRKKIFDIAKKDAWNNADRNRSEGLNLETNANDIYEKRYKPGCLNEINTLKLKSSRDNLAKERMAEKIVKLYDLSKRKARSELIEESDLSIFERVVLKDYRDTKKLASARKNELVGSMSEILILYLLHSRNENNIILSTSQRSDRSIIAFEPDSNEEWRFRKGKGNNSYNHDIGIYKKHQSTDQDDPNQLRIRRIKSIQVKTIDNPEYSTSGDYHEDVTVLALRNYIPNLPRYRNTMVFARDLISKDSPVSSESLEDCTRKLYQDIKL